MGDIKLPSEEAKNREEANCVAVFEEWQESLGVKFSHKDRPEDIFSDLQIKWEFVAWYSGTSKWLGIEVKSLVYPEGNRLRAMWEKVVRRADEMLRGNLAGRFLLALPPRYVFSQSQARELGHALAEAVKMVAPALEKGELRDIGPDIRVSYPDWPVDLQKPGEWDQVRGRRIYPPRELDLIRSKEDGSSLGIGAGPVVAYWHESALIEAVHQALDLRKPGPIKASKQLIMAKRKGAAKTHLLLHNGFEFDWEPKLVKQILQQVDGSRFEGIDEIFLVGGTSSHVAKVWP